MELIRAAVVIFVMVTLEISLSHPKDTTWERLKNICFCLLAGYIVLCSYWYGPENEHREYLMEEIGDAVDALKNGDQEEREDAISDLEELSWGENPFTGGRDPIGW